MCPSNMSRSGRIVKTTQTALLKLMLGARKRMIGASYLVSERLIKSSGLGFRSVMVTMNALQRPIRNLLRI